MHACFFCLDSDPPPIQSGCACRSDGGFVHVECRVQDALKRDPDAWQICKVCDQPFTGPLAIALAQELWSRKRNLPGHNNERIHALDLMATSLHKQGRYSEAEAMHREGVAIKRKVRGDEHPTTLDSAGSLANALSRQGKFAEAATIQREVLEVKKRLFGTEHESTLACANDMGQILVGQEKFSQAEAMHRETHAAGKRTNGAPHACGL